MPKETRDNQQSEPSRPTFRDRLLSLGGSGRLLWAWATSSQYRTALMAGACLVSAAGMVYGGLLIASGGPGGKAVTLEQVLQTLDSGAYIEARELAEQLLKQGTLPPEELGGPVFALGAAAAYEADDTWSKDKQTYYLLAARHLEEARDRGFPPGRRDEGLFLLGKSLYMTGQIPASRRVLLAALKVSKRRKTEIHHLLAGAYLNDANPLLEKALAESELFLSDRRLSPIRRNEGLFQRAQILLGLSKIPECLATLDEIPENARNHAEAVIIRGRVLIHEAQMLKNNPAATPEDQLRSRKSYEAAITTLRKAQGRDTLSTQATRKAIYLIGTCFLEMGEDRKALVEFVKTNKLYPDTAEGLAASFQEAELSRKHGRDSNALAAYRRTLAAVSDPDNFSNPWMTLDQLRERMLIAYQDYQDAQNFDISLQLARMFYPLFSRVRMLELTAIAHDAWGRGLLGQAVDLPPEKAEPIRRQGRAQLRKAGGVYIRLAELLIATRRYPDQLWNSADAYLQGQDYRNAARVLQKYLKNTSRKRHPQALVKLGEALLALNQVEEALEQLRDCVVFHPKDAAAYRARLLASRTHVETGDLKQAEELLLENLNGEEITPHSPEYRDSLFALGELLYIDRRYEEVIERLEYEAIIRYQDDPQAPCLNARFLIADSYRQRAKAAQEKLRQDLAESGRPVQSKQINELFGKAFEKYKQLQEDLSKRRDTAELMPLEESMLRNCYFALGDIESDRGRYEAAIDAFSAATNRYRDYPEVLEAYVQIANAYRRLNKPVEARATLEQARAVLARMKPDLNFTRSTNYTREQWSTRLDWISSL